MSIKVEGLTKVFGDNRAVDDVTFEVESGKVTGFLGPNGAGKSTTMRIILGLIYATAGSATVLGRPYRELAEPGRSVGALLDEAQFHPARTGRNHLKILAATMSVPEARVDELLQLTGLGSAARRKAGTYSLGMRQRLGIAAALLGSPEVLVFDEPANGLDPAGMRWLRGFLRSLASDDKTVFVSSHLLDEISHMADDIIVINKGRLVTQASVDELVHKASGGARVVTSHPERLRDVLAGAGISVSLISHDTLMVSAPTDVVGRIALEAGVPISGLNEEHQSLEDVFLELTEQG